MVYNSYTSRFHIFPIRLVVAIIFAASRRNPQTHKNLSSRRVSSLPPLIRNRSLIFATTFVTHTTATATVTAPSTPDTVISMRSRGPPVSYPTRLFRHYFFIPSRKLRCRLHKFPNCIVTNVPQSIHPLSVLYFTINSKHKHTLIAPHCTQPPAHIAQSVVQPTHMALHPAPYPPQSSTAHHPSTRYCTAHPDGSFRTC